MKNNETKGLFKFAGSKNWYFRFFDTEGKRRTVTLGTDDLAVAIQKKREILGGQLVAVAAPVVKARSIGIYTVIDDYLKEAMSRRKKPMRPGTAHRKGYVLRQFVKAQDIEYVGQITRGAIDAWLKGFEKAGRSAETVHTYARDIHTFVAYLVKLKLTHHSLIQDFDIPERAAVGRKNWIKRREVRRVIGEAQDDNMRFILFAGFHAGLRKNEIVQAKVSWFDLEAGFLHVQNDPKSGFVLKDKENRSIPLTEDFKTFAHGFLTGRELNEYAIRPAKLKGAWHYRYDFSRAFKSHMKRCGVMCNVHDMRRSFASNLVSEGESVYIVAKWLGDGVQVVERSYGHLAPSAGNINRLAAP